MKLYVINLLDRADRRRHMEAELARVGADFVHFPAVDARTDPAVAEWADRPASRVGYTISDGAVACTLSHRKIWRMLLDGADSHAMVLEDDVFLSSDFAAYLAPGWIPTDADLVKIETTRNRVHLGRARVATRRARAVHRLLSRHSCTGAYIVSRKGAESLLEATVPPVDAVDEVMFAPGFGWMDRATVYQLTPALAIQAEYADHTTDLGSFAESSIALRSTDTGITEGAETPAQRLLRRGENELKALRLGSRYVTVPFVR